MVRMATGQAVKHTLVWIICVCLWSISVISETSPENIPLESAIGVTTYFKKNQNISFLTWKIIPKGANIFFFKCSYKTTLYMKTAEVVLLSQDIQHDNHYGLIAFLKGRGSAQLTDDSFIITLKNPQVSDEGWYFCLFNTLKSVDITGALQLKRQIDLLESVEAIDTTYPSSSTSVNLTWKYHPRKSDIESIKCFQKGVLVYKYSGTSESLKNNLEHILTPGQFTLKVTDVSAKEEGMFQCIFSPGHHVAPIKSELILVNQKDRWVVMQQNVTEEKTCPLAVAAATSQTGSNGWKTATITLSVIVGILLVVGLIVILMRIWNGRPVSKRKKHEDKCPEELLPLTKADTKSDLEQKIEKLEKDNTTLQTEMMGKQEQWAQKEENYKKSLVSNEKDIRIKELEVEKEIENNLQGKFDEKYEELKRKYEEMLQQCNNLTTENAILECKLDNCRYQLSKKSNVAESDTCSEIKHASGKQPDQTRREKNEDDRSPYAIPESGRTVDILKEKTQARDDNEAARSVPGSGVNDRHKPSQDSTADHEAANSEVNDIRQPSPDSTDNHEMARSAPASEVNDEVKPSPESTDGNPQK